MRHKIRTAKWVKYGSGLVMLMAAFFLFRHFDGASEASQNFTDHPTASFGIAAGQVARLNVVNTNARERKIFVINFLDEDGNLLKTARATVEPKHSFGLLLPYSELERGELRTQVRAVVRMQGSRSNRLLGGVEIYDQATGRTSFGLLLPASDFDPQPEPPAPQ